MGCELLHDLKRQRALAACARDDHACGRGDHKRRDLRHKPIADRQDAEDLHGFR